MFPNGTTYYTCTLTTCPIASQYSSRVRWPLLYSPLRRWILASRVLHFRFRVSGASPLSAEMTDSSKRPCSSFNFLRKSHRDGCIRSTVEFQWWWKAEMKNRWQALNMVDMTCSSVLKHWFYLGLCKLFSAQEFRRRYLLNELVSIKWIMSTTFL